MNRADNINRIRITAGIMSGMMLLVIVLSFFFIASHADHDCTGDDCPICACMQQCEKNIRGTGSGITAMAAVSVPVFMVLLHISSGVSSLQWDTPVSNKVRLNN